MTTDDELKKKRLEQLRAAAAKSPTRLTNLLAGMFATVDAEHDFEDPALDDFLVAIVARQEEPCEAAYFAMFMVMCKCSVVPTLQRLAAAGRIRVVDGNRYGPNPEDTQ